MRFLNRITLQTPESVELEFVLAGIGNRALALLIDYSILFFTFCVLLLVWIFLLSPLLELRVQVFGSADDLSPWILAVTLLVVFFIYSSYFVVFETLWQGQTPGKRWVRIRVIQDTGRIIGLQQAILRSLLRPIDELFFFAVGSFLIMLGRQEKRLGDWVAGTIAIQEERPTTQATFPISQTARNLVGYLQQESTLSQLRPDDFAIIREYLQRRAGMVSQSKSELSLKLARQSKTLISLAEVPPNVTPDQFLEAVYLAYQAQAESRF